MGSSVGSAARQAPNRGERICGHKIGPNQVPQRIDVLRAVGDRQTRGQQGIEERRAPLVERCHDLLAEVLFLFVVCLMLILFGDIPTHPAVGITDRPISDPIDLAGSG